MKEIIYILKQFLIFDIEAKKGILASIVTIVSATIYKIKANILLNLNIENSQLEIIIDWALKWISIFGAIGGLLVVVLTSIHKWYEIKEDIYKLKQREKDNKDESSN